MQKDMAIVTREMYDDLRAALMKEFAEANDKEVREHFEEKPKKDHVGFDDTNKFFKRGKRRWAQNR